MNDLILDLGKSIGANFIYDVAKGLIKLLPHQEKNLSNWLNKWNPKKEDIEIIAHDENSKRMYSILFEKVQNELFEEKLSGWGCIADNVLHSKETELNYDLFFIKLFSELDLSVLHYLLWIKSKKQVTSKEIYQEGFPPPSGSKSKINFFLSGSVFISRPCVYKYKWSY